MAVTVFCPLSSANAERPGPRSTKRVVKGGTFNRRMPCTRKLSSLEDGCAFRVERLQSILRLLSSALKVMSGKLGSAMPQGRSCAAAFLSPRIQ